MVKARRRKTPETDVGARIRAYAATYAGSGQKERAEGMLQAADMFDQEMAKLGTEKPAVVGPVLSAIVNWKDFAKLERRVARLERIITKPIIDFGPVNGVDTTATQAVDIGATFGPPTPDTLIRVVDRLPADAELAKGATSILSALYAGSRNHGRTLDEIIALVGLKETSVRKYVGDLAAAGYATQSTRAYEQGRAPRVRLTEHGEKAAAELPAWNCIGEILFDWWLGHVSRGESMILLSLGKVVSGDYVTLSIRDFLEHSQLSLRETSIRKYLSDLQRRRLVVRSKDGYALAPILRSGAT